MKSVFVFLAVTILAAYAAPSAPGLEEKLRALQEQIYTLEKENSPAGSNNAPKDQIFEFMPQKRMVAWQPMKRGLLVQEDSRTPLVHAIEARLAEVLRAGERLGVNPEEVLADLRNRNQFQ